MSRYRKPVSQALSELLARYSDVRRTFGDRRALRIAATWMLRREFLVISRDLRQPEPPMPAGPSLQFTQLEDKYIPRMLALSPALTKAEIRANLAAGAQCLLVWVDSELAHWRWDTTLPVYLRPIGKTFHPAPGDIFSFGVITRPEFRNRGIHSASTAIAARHFSERGMRRMIATVAWWNRPSLRVMIEKNDRTVVGSIGYRNLGLRRKYFSTGAVVMDTPTSFAVSTSAPSTTIPDRP